MTLTESELAALNELRVAISAKPIDPRPEREKRRLRLAERIARYWSDSLLLADKREAFHLALTRILMRESVCDCSPERQHDYFPHFCPAATPRQIRVDHDPDDLLLEALGKIGVECRGWGFSARGLLPEKTRMWITGDVVTVNGEVIE